MNMTRNRLHTIGWGMALTICFALTMILTSYVNAVKSKVRLAERDIVKVELEKQELETEFETRSSHEQLEKLNRAEFGYEAPRAEQYLEGERQLAMLGTPRGKDAPAPIRVAAADVREDASPNPALQAVERPVARAMPVLAVLRDEAQGPAPTRHAKAGRSGDLAARLSQPAREGVAQ